MANPDGKKGDSEAMALLLAGGASVAHVAEKTGVCERPIHRRLQLPAFRARISELRSAFVQGAIGRLSMLGALAVDELHRLIKHGDSDAIKLGAARTVLQYMVLGHEREILAVQIAEQQRQLDELRAEQEQILRHRTNGHARLPMPYATPPVQESQQSSEAMYPPAPAQQEDDDDDLEPFEMPEDLP
jgi:hypothetical protein